MHIAATASNIGPLPFHGDDKWVQRHLIHRDAERVERNSPESSYSSVETGCFNRAEFTKQIQVRRIDHVTLLLHATRCSKYFFVMSTFHV